MLGEEKEIRKKFSANLKNGENPAQHFELTVLKHKWGQKCGSQIINKNLM